MIAMDFFYSLQFLQCFNQYCSNLLKKLTVRGLILYYVYDS